MNIFGRRKEKDYEDEDEIQGGFPVRDLKPENKKKRIEPPKPWGRKERLTVLTFLLGTVLISGILAASSRNWKLPGFPRINLPDISGWNFDFWGEETITIGRAKRTADPFLVERGERVKGEFTKKTKDLSGTYALFVIDLTSGYSFGENENETLKAASLIKLPVIASIYSEAETGNINLDKAPSGSNLTFGELAREMGKKSSNQAQVAIVKALGEEKVTNVIDKAMMKSTSYSENETTAADIGLFFQKLWNKEVVSESSRDEILKHLTDTIYEDWIKKGIPEVRVAHKYGREVHVISDAGVVFANNPFVLVIMSEGVVDKEADAFIPQMASLVFEELGD
ncbi:serine hydrolase [Candidatus Woesebacteria bacterium]|nr:serine hydrolase [Candidatus Woesebacteria bacterium]